MVASKRAAGKNINSLFNVPWKMDKRSSRFSTDWVPEKETRLYEPVKGGYRLTVRGVRKGKNYEWGYTALYDGKPHHVYGRDDVDSIEAYKINDRVTIGFFRKGIVFGGPYSRHLSKDGKTLVVQAAGRNGSRAFYDVIKYVR